MLKHEKLRRTCAFPPFLKGYLFKLLVGAFVQNCNVDNIYQKNFFIGALKFFLKFSKHFLKKIRAEKPFSGILQDVLKKFAKFTRKLHHFLIKPPEIKILHHRCFSVNFMKLLRTPFLQNISGRVGVCL